MCYGKFPSDNIKFALVGIEKSIMPESQQLSSFTGYIFACTKSSEKECFDLLVFGTNKIYAGKISSVKAGDRLFLFNLDSDRLYGTFIARTNGGYQLVPGAWKGKYPYQVKVSEDDQGIKVIEGAKKILSKMGISWKERLDDQKTKSLLTYLDNPKEFEWGPLVAERVLTGKNRREDIEFEKPRL